MIRRVLLLAVVIFLIVVPDETQAWWRRRRRRRCGATNCVVGPWTSWSSCSSSCMGTQTRTRSKTKTESCGGSCPYPLSQARPCNNVCQNGGTRHYYGYGYGGGCSCRPGFSGRCCQHGGSCQEGQVKYNKCGERCKCRGGKLTECTRIRKEFTKMTTAERTKYINAIKVASTDARYKAEYDNLITVHRTLFSQQIHNRENFLPWHRWYILQYENILRKVDCTVTVAYWDWSRVSTTPWRGLSSDVWYTGSSGFGGNGSPCVQTGPFKWPGWRLVPSAGSGCLRRQFSGFPPDTIAVQQVLNKPSSDFTDFEFELRISLHDNVHCLILGTMCTRHAASAPEFFLHHGFVDKLWADWQARSSSHHDVFFSTLTQNMPGTSYNPGALRDLKAQPGGVRVEYQSVGSNGGPPGGRPIRPRFSTVNNKAMSLFQLNPTEIQKAKEVAKKLDPTDFQVVGPDIFIKQEGTKGKEGLSGPQ